MSASGESRVVVMGAGGMGALFGAILADGGLDVTLVDSDQAHVDAIRHDGLCIVGHGGARTVHIPITDDARSLDAADIVLFQCKANGTVAAAHASTHLLDGGATAVSFQNGLGNEEAIADIVGVGKVLGGITSMAGCREAPGVVRDFSRVPSTIGEMAGGLSERAQHIAQVLTSAGLETHASADIVTAIWKKLLGNIAMSAVSGVTRLTSAQALAVPALEATCLRALDEALAVAGSSGIRLEREAALAGLREITPAGGTGDNKSSLCVDLENRRHSEVETIYGAVIERARSHGIATPTLDTLYAVVKGIESGFAG